MKFYTAFLLCLVLYGITPQAQGQKPEIISEKKGPLYLLFIACDTYQEWPNLSNQVQDAEDIDAILEERYQVDKVIKLYNKKATKSNIINTFTELQTALKPNASLMIFYSGHSVLNEESGANFWIPNDAGNDTLTQKNWLSDAQITIMISRLKAGHVFLVADSFFTASLLNLTNSEQKDTRIESAPQQKRDQLTSRIVLASGYPATASNVSAFTFQIKLSLMNNEDFVLSPLVLFDEITHGMKKTVPILGDLKNSGHKAGGNFYFYLKEGNKKKQSGIITLNIMYEGSLYLDSSLYRQTKPGKTIIKDLSPGEHLFEMRYPDGKSEAMKLKILDTGDLTADFTYLPSISITDTPISYKPEDIDNPDHNWGSILAEVNGGPVIPFGTLSDVFDIGYRAKLNIAFPVHAGTYGNTSFGLSSGYEEEAVQKKLWYRYKIHIIPICACADWSSKGTKKMYVSGKISMGTALCIFNFENTTGVTDSSSWVPYGEVGLSGGFILGAGLSVQLNCDSVMMLMPDNTLFFGLIPGISLRLVL